MKKPGARAIYFTAAEMLGIEHVMLNLKESLGLNATIGSPVMVPTLRVTWC